MLSAARGMGKRGGDSGEEMGAPGGGSWRGCRGSGLRGRMGARKVAEGSQEAIGMAAASAVGRGVGGSRSCRRRRGAAAVFLTLEVDGEGREDGWGCRKVSGRSLGRWPEGGGRCWLTVEREEELEGRLAGGFPEIGEEGEGRGGG